MDNQNKKILVVDDDIRLRELLQRYLTEQGYTIKVASDAKEMDAVLAEEPIDLVGEVRNLQIVNAYCFFNLFQYKLDFNSKDLAKAV